MDLHIRILADGVTVKQVTQGAKQTERISTPPSGRQQDINKWDMEGNQIETFSIPGVSALRDLAYDAPISMARDAAATSGKDFENHTLVSTITTPAAESRHCLREDPTASGLTTGRQSSFW
jgi:hypothetical protein